MLVVAVAVAAAVVVVVDMFGDETQRILGYLLDVDYFAAVQAQEFK